MSGLLGPVTANPNMLAQALKARQQPRTQLNGQGLLDTAAIGLSPVPVIGDVLGLAADASRFVNEPESRTPLNFGLAALGLLPFVPSAAGISKAVKPEYGMAHRPVTVAGGAAQLHDLETAFGPDIYGKNAAQYFGTGDSKLDRQTLGLLGSLRGKPDAMVTIYRAVPLDAKDAAIRSGDWVTVNKNYAVTHGEGTLGGKYRIVEQQVPASHLTTNADSFHEQGYYPPK